MVDTDILASCGHHFIRLHENLVQHQSNNILIVKIGSIKGLVLLLSKLLHSLKCFTFILLLGVLQQICMFSDKVMLLAG